MSFIFGMFVGIILCAIGICVAIALGDASDRKEFYKHRKRF